jgi:hypothetical protein
VDAVVTYVTGPVGQIFLRLLFMLVIPLLFSALVVGIAEMGEIRSLKRSASARWSIPWWSHHRRVHQPGGGQPAASGRGVDPAAAQSCWRRAAKALPGSWRHRRTPRPASMQLVNIVPSNVITAMSQQRHPGGHVLRAVLRHRPAAVQTRGPPR